MVKSTHKLRTKKPVSVFDKPLKADFKQLFKSLCKGVGHGVAGNWAELGSDTVETLSAVGRRIVLPIDSTFPDEGLV